MKNILLLLLLAFSSLAPSATAGSTELAPKFEPLQEQARAAHLAAEILTKYHYKHVPLDDTTSSKIFDLYLKALDSEKIFFTLDDIEQFETARTQLDDSIYNEDLSIPFNIYNVYRQRIAERISYARSLLKSGFEFNSNESYQPSRKKALWAKSQSEMNELWRMRVKNDWLRLKIAGKNDKSIVDTLDKRYESSLIGISKFKSDDVFQNFMNAYTMAIDPHTNYFGIRASEDFDISMRLSLVGIGAVLQDRDEYTTIRELVAGGPAALSGRLNIGDRIVGVGQGEKSTPVEVMGWRIDDTVALIRGAEDSTVVLDVLPVDADPDGEHKLITLVRKKISLDKQAAKKSIMEIKEGDHIRHIGVIALPGFYQDFVARQKGDKDFKSATRDVSRLLDELKQDKVESVLIDLRNNGGGSLDEAVELTGLFIDKGPVVQERDSKGNIRVEKDDKPGLAWNGPMGVLINRASASASEIFAAAIQDYGRGVIIGEQSFGKGTVQSVVDLDQVAKNEKPKFGELKMTIAQFFRISGGTTQLRGVTPDISLPTTIDTDDFGESSYENALPWIQIQAADYVPTGDLSALIPKLIARHEERTSKDKDFQELNEDLAELKIRRTKNIISLNEAERRKERETQGERAKLREKNNKVIQNGKTTEKNDNVVNSAPLQDDGLQSNERNINADIALENLRKNAKDPLLNEAVNILNDEIGLLLADPKLTDRVLPGNVRH